MFFNFLVFSPGLCVLFKNRMFKMLLIYMLHIKGREIQFFFLHIDEERGQGHFDSFCCFSAL